MRFSIHPRYTRPHSPAPGTRTGQTWGLDPLSPNESYAIAVARTGYLPVALSAEGYIELPPAGWRAVRDCGIKVNYAPTTAPNSTGCEGGCPG